MDVQHNSVQRFVKAGQLAASALLMLRIGGFAPDVIPSGSVSLAVLVVLSAFGRAHEFVEARGRAAAVADARAWVAEHWFWLGLCCVTVVAALLRLAGIAENLGHVALGIDENRLNTSVLYLFRSGDINYRTVEHYPGIHYWTLAGTYLLAYLRGLMGDVATTLARMPVEYFAAAGRVVSALQSTATVLVTGLLGRRLAGPRSGLLAAALLAVAPLSISLGRQLRNDAAQTLLIVAAVYVALGMHRRAHAGWAPALGGALAGLAAGVKYTGVFVLVPVLLAAATSEDRQRRARGLGLAACGFLAASLISNHFVWADIPNLVDQLSDQILITGEGHWAAQANPAAFHARILAERVIGWPLLILAAATAASRLAFGPWKWRLFLVYPLTYIWFVAQRPSQFPRWVYPAAPFAAVAACAGLIALADLLETRVARRAPESRWRRVVGPAMVMAFFAPILLTTASNLSRQASTPTYTLAERWIEENTAPGDRILIGRNWLSLAADRHRLRRVRSLGDVLDGGSRYELAANDWIVVHEALLGHSALERLRLAEAITVEASFGGNQGPDFRIFEAPAVAPIEGVLIVRSDDRNVRDYLGHEWPARQLDQAGRELPADGARLFLPPVGEATRRLSIDIASGSPEASPGIEIYAGGRRLAPLPAQPIVEDVTATEMTGAETVTVELSIATVGPRVVELFLRPPAGGGPVHILGFRLE